MAHDKELIAWYVLRCHRSTSLVEMTLGESGAEFYIPKRKVTRVYHGKKQDVLVPVITNTVFIHGSWTEVDELKKQYDKVLFYKFWPIRYSHTQYEPMYVREAEMNNFRRVCDNMDADLCFMTAEEAEKLKGKRVRIVSGTFAGVEGIVLRRRGKSSNRVVVHLGDMAYISTAEINPADLEVLDS